MPLIMKNAGLSITTTGDLEGKSTRDVQSSRLPSVSEQLSQRKPLSGKGKERQTACTNGENPSKKDDDKKDNAKQHKIRMPQRKGGLQLWQFLYALLEDADKQHSELIEWTHNRKELEFRLNDPEAIALWWGIIKHRANMTYERLSRSLRYYYDRGILKKMGGERYLYRFCIDPEDMYQHIGLSDSRPVLKQVPLPVNKWVSNKMIPGSQHLEPFYLNPDYLSMGVPQQHLPPPPPYPGYQFQSPPQYHQLTSPQMNYDFFTEQDTTTGDQSSFIFNQPLDSFNVSSLSAGHNPGALFGSNTAFALHGSSSQVSLSYSNLQLHQSEQQERSATDVLSDTDSDKSPLYSTSFPSLPTRFTTNTRDNNHMLQYSPESNLGFQCDSSNVDSGSGSELDEIIPLLELMEDSDCLPLSMRTSPSCTFSPYPNASVDSGITHSTNSSPNVYSSCSQMPFQASPTLSTANTNGFSIQSPWMQEDTWKFS